MALRKKIFRIDETLSTVFEAWCQTHGLKQQHAAEAALLQLIALSPDERQDLFITLGEWKASRESEPATQGDVGAAVAAALERRRKARAPAKRRRGRQSA